MTKTKITGIALVAATTLSALAQSGIRLPDPYERLNRAEKKLIQNQASSMFSVTEPIVKASSKSTVSVHSFGKRISFGTAVRTKNTQPAILTKWSEISRTRGPLTIATSNDKFYPAKISGVYPEHDLALVTTEAPLQPIDLTNSAKPELGNFLVLARPDGKVEGIGVVSVLARSLREKDKAYLGVMMDFSKAGKEGVPLERVMPDSGAMKAGLRKGDVIVSVDQKPITGAMEMRNLLQRLVPGSEILVGYRRIDEEKTTTVKLGSRADNADIRRVPRERMERMQRMGTTPNRVRSDFPNVIQSDMAIESNDMGAPVLDLDGKMVGITIARGSRIKTFITPTDTLVKVLAFDPTPVKQALAAQENAADTSPRSAQRRGPRTSTLDDDPAAKVRRLLGEIEKNNRLNEDILREVEDQLRQLEREEQDR